MELIFELRVVVVGIESRIAQKGLVRQLQMRGKEVRKERLQGNRISDFFVLIRIIRLFLNNFRVLILKSSSKNSICLGIPSPFFALFVVSSTSIIAKNGEKSVVNTSKNPVFSTGF